MSCYLDNNFPFYLAVVCCIIIYITLTFTLNVHLHVKHLSCVLCYEE